MELANAISRRISPGAIDSGTAHVTLFVYERKVQNAFEMVWSTRHE
jgi:hypothetical protein